MEPVHSSEALRAYNLAMQFDLDGAKRLVSQVRKPQIPEDQTIFNPDIDADALVACIALYRGHYTQAGEIARHVVDAVSRDKDSATYIGREMVAAMEYVLGAVEYQDGNISDSFAHLQQSLNESRKVGSVDMQIQVPLLLGQIGSEIGNMAGALAQLRKVESIVDTLADGKLTVDRRLRILTECAKIAINICDIRQADRMLAKSSLLYDKAEDNNKIFYLEQLVRFRFLFDQYSQASSALNRLEMLVRKNRKNHNMTDVYIFQGLARSRMGELEWAEKYLHLADTATLQMPLTDSCLYHLLKGETQLLARKPAEAYKSLFLYAPAAVHTQFHDFVTRESQRSYYITMNEYENAYNLMAEDRRRSESLQNDIFSFSDRQRDEAIREQDAQRETEIVDLRSTIEQSRENALLTYGMMAISSIVVGVIVFVYVRRRMKKAAAQADEQNVVLRNELANRLKELEERTAMLSATNMRISESIAYAEHIQHSMSPSPEALNEYPISGSFIFYSPLDVVSGDFFWFTRKGENLIVCCADCTGHGVPGAFMSMMAVTIINDICDRITVEQPDPSKMLEKLDQTLVENLAHNMSQSGNSKDGLDISIAVLNLDTHVLQIAAARRPVIIVNSMTSQTIRGSKRSIGERDPRVRSRAFETHTIQMKPGDCFYMYSDGYSDQFGGLNGEKMKNGKIEKFLMQIHDDDMDEQSLTVQELFTQWKGDFPQIDDVLFIGIKV